MGMKYDKLFALLKSRGMNRSYIVTKGVVSRVTMAKLSKGATVRTDVLCAICAYLKCDVSDIMEYQFDPLNVPEKAQTCESETGETAE